eukprot:COSAG06_NODE_27050_length_602_cov_1.041750_1_plen_193_part_01
MKTPCPAAESQSVSGSGEGGGAGTGAGDSGVRVAAEWSRPPLWHRVDQTPSSSAMTIGALTMLTPAPDRTPSIASEYQPPAAAAPRPRAAGTQNEIYVRMEMFIIYICWGCAQQKCAVPEAHRTHADSSRQHPMPRPSSSHRLVALAQHLRSTAPDPTAATELSNFDGVALEGQVAVVMGASRGIGKGVALAL